MIYAQITNSLVINCIDLEDPTLIPIFSAGFDYFIEIDAIVPMPSIGWGYNSTSNSFTPPTPALPFVMNGLYTVNINEDYTKLQLHDEETIDATGQLTNINYYTNYDGTTYSGLAITEAHVYTRDPNTDLLEYLTYNINWLLSDGSVGATKTKIQYYNFTYAIAEGKTRRANLIAQVEGYVLNTVGLTNGIAYMTELSTYIDAYILGTKQPLITQVTNSTDSFLTPTIIAQIVSMLTYSL